ncbi:MAG: hypothetical protein H6742_00760 [Alphaproteobacteria bacterium]|nr:hypothetical protein [Alphaproteobacteria bacterium]
MTLSQPLAAPPFPTLDDAAATDPARCGHKAATLAALRQAGADVPPGFVIPAGATVGLDDPTLAAALARLAGPVAVRSSGIAEDLPDASFAGQYDTVLDVHGPAAVVAAVEVCRASCRSERAQAYGADAAGMAVLVQAMVPADAAGVAFSANPVTGDRDEVLVSATGGLGDRLVSGEVDGDAWTIRGQEATATSRPEGCIDEDTARRVARLATDTAEALGHPVDIEWAVHDGRLALLQARPITALPTAPVFEVPEGTWQKDCAHYPGPISPFGATTYLTLYAHALRTMIAHYGLMPDEVEVVAIGHEVYTHAKPDHGSSAPPPWWVLGVVARLVPSIRRKLARAQEVWDEGLLERTPERWEQEWRPQLQAEIARLASVDLRALDDEALLAHLDEQVMPFAQRGMDLHFELFIPYIVGVHGLKVACEELLGWSSHEAMTLLQGLSTASSRPTEELQQVAERARGSAAACAAIEPGGPDFLARLDAAAPEVAQAMRAWLGTWGLRTMAYDPGEPCLAEQPDLVAALLWECLTQAPVPDHDAPRTAAVAAARAALSDPAARDRFDRALARAERVYPQREDNVLYTDNLPCGLMRAVALEAGRRLVARGGLARPTDAVLLTRAELGEALLGARDDARAIAARVRCEQAWVRAHPGDNIYGPIPGPMPDVRGLPLAARTINGAMLWAMSEELSPPALSATSEVTGKAGAPGIASGSVRVIHSSAQVHEVRPGDVVVCPITTPAWTVIFQRAAALVTDSGSVLSHAAIVAREHGIPAVIATGDGTRKLVDGERVTVDGNRGTVTRA